MLRACVHPYRLSAAGSLEAKLLVKLDGKAVCREDELDEANLHMASMWGWPMKLFVCMPGLVVTMLSATAALIWNRKRKARRSARLKRGVPIRSNGAEAGLQCGKVLFPAGERSKQPQALRGLIEPTRPPSIVRHKFCISCRLFRSRSNSFCIDNNSFCVRCRMSCVLSSNLGRLKWAERSGRLHKSTILNKQHAKA